MTVFLRAFPWCTLAAKTETSTAIANLMLLTTAVIVDNLAEKVDVCPLNWGHQVLFAYN